MFLLVRKDFLVNTDKKVNKIFLIYDISGNSKGSGAKSYMTNDLLTYGENICALPHILESHFSYNDFAPDPICITISLYMRKILFSFLSVYCLL